MSKIFLLFFLFSTSISLAGTHPHGAEILFYKGIVQVKSSTSSFAGVEKGEVLIEGDTLKPIKKHVKPNSDKDFPEGGIIEKDPTIHISNLMLLDPKSGEPTRIGRKRVEIELKGKKKTTTVRYSKKSQEEII